MNPETNPLEWGHDWIVVETRLGRFTYPSLRSLEWGHDWIVVETVQQPFASLIVSGVLEWGHDWIVVETRLAPQVEHHLPRLNGATTG